MTIKPIKTERDYQKALKEIEKLWDAKPNTSKGDRLEVMITLVEAYEQKHHRIEPPVSGVIMKTNLKRKNYYLDEKKIRRVRSILGAKTETEAIDAALDLVVFQKDILKSLEKVAGKGGVEKVF